MFYQMLKKERKVIQPLTLVLFLIISALFLLITLLSQISTDRVDRVAAEISEQSLVQVEKAFIENKLGARVSDVLYIADSLLLSGIADDDYSALERQWAAFSSRKTVYDQIRYIDSGGDEVIRINYHDNAAEIVAKQDLQNKKDRYYFTSTMALQQDQIYISELDLNIEFGAIEQPIKPMLRLATPFFGNGGEKEGMVILNYSAQDMLKQVDSIASTSAGDIFLLNRDGYWLYDSADKAKEWAFMYEDRMDVSFAREFPQEWEAILGGGDGSVYTANGAFSYTSIVLNADLAGVGGASSLLCDSGSFYIVSYIDHDSDTGALFSQSIPQRALKVFLKYLSVYFLISGIAFALAVLIAMNRARKKEIKFFSEYDAMTGVYNRRAGYGKLNALKGDQTRKACRIAVCFTDINGLKDVNDRLGHDAGDELIKSVADAIKGTVRGNDFVARLGGDEFLIVFDGLTAEDAQKVWDRVLQRFAKINGEENRGYVISVSHGIGVFSCGGSETIDDIITQADAMMYEEKRRIKKGLNVIRGREINKS